MYLHLSNRALKSEGTTGYLPKRIARQPEKKNVVKYMQTISFNGACSMEIYTSCIPQPA